MVATYAPVVPAANPAQPSKPVAPNTNPQPFPWHLAGIGREDPRFRGWWQPKGVTD